MPWHRGALGQLFARCSLALCCTAATVNAEQATLAVASNFAAPMAALVTEFEATHKHQLKVATGSSGKLFAQIQHGAPFHLFFSADQAKPKALVEAGLTASGRRWTYATGKLALWSPTPGQAHVLKARLLRGDYQRLALANPKHAPYGMAAKQSLDALGVTEPKGRSWVRGENIAQTFQFAMTGNADFGFVALSQISQAGQVLRGSAWLVPESLHQPIRQDAVLLKNGLANKAAIDFVDFVRSARGQGIIAGYGYRTEPKPPTAMH